MTAISSPWFVLSTLFILGLVLLLLPSKKPAEQVKNDPKEKLPVVNPAKDKDQGKDGEPIKDKDRQKPPGDISRRDARSIRSS